MTDLGLKTLFATSGKSSSFVAVFVACCAVFGVVQIGQGFYATTNAQHSVLRLGESAILQEGVRVQTLAFQHIKRPGPVSPGTSLVAADGEAGICSLKRLAVGYEFDVVMAEGQKVTLKVTGLKAADWQSQGSELNALGSTSGAVTCQSLVGKTPEQKL